MAALATPTQLGNLLGETIPETDTRALAVLTIASDLVRSYVVKTWEPEEVPSGANSVTLDVAGRVWTNPASLESDGLDDVQRRFGTRGTEGYYLTAANRMILDGLKPKRRGFGIVSTTRGDYNHSTIFVPTAPAPSGQGFPFLDSDDL